MGHVGSLYLLLLRHQTNPAATHLLGGCFTPAYLSVTENSSHNNYSQWRVAWPVSMHCTSENFWKICRSHRLHLRRVFWALPGFPKVDPSLVLKGDVVLCNLRKSQRSLIFLIHKPFGLKLLLALLALAPTEWCKEFPTDVIFVCKVPNRLQLFSSKDNLL